MVTFVTTPKGEELAILPRAEYERLAAIEARAAVEAAEEAGDVADSRAIFADVDAGRGEWLTPADVEAMAAAPSPVAFWLRKRAMTQAGLAFKTRLSQSYISKLARGEATGTVETLRKIADVLGVRVDDLAD